MIKIILENLVENAIQFCTPDNPIINFKAFNVGNNCVMEVEDNGSGIPLELHNKIFEMYFRGSVPEDASAATEREQESFAALPPLR